MISRLETVWNDPARRARLLWGLWLVSTAFTLFGFAVIFYRILFSR